MQELLKSKLVTSLIVISTVILAGVAIFTALRLYQLRTRPVAPTAPESQPAAESGWPECVIGNPSHNVQGCRQRAEQYKGVSGPSSTSDSDWLSWAQSAPNPLSRDTSCGLAPSACESQKVSCQSLAFTLSTPSSTPTVTPTATITPTASPTITPTVTDTITPTQPPGSSPTSTPTQGNTSTPTTGSQTSTLSPTPGGAALPDAGISTPTIIAGFAGLLLILFALILAL